MQEDSWLKFVLYNLILTFGGGGFLIWHFPFFLLCQNLESDGLSETLLLSFPDS